MRRPAHVILTVTTFRRSMLVILSIVSVCQNFVCCDLISVSAWVDFTRVVCNPSSLSVWADFVRAVCIPASLSAWVGLLRAVCDPGSLIDSRVPCGIAARLLGSRAFLDRVCLVGLSRSFWDCRVSRISFSVGTCLAVTRDCQNNNRRLFVLI